MELPRWLASHSSLNLPVALLRVEVGAAYRWLELARVLLYWAWP